MNKVYTLFFQSSKKSFLHLTVKCFLLVSLICCFGNKGFAQISLTSGSLTYSQNFDGYTATSSTFATELPNWTVTTLPAPTVFRAQGNGSSASGGVWSFGATTADGSAGYLGSGGATSIVYTVLFVNNTGSVITNLDIAFNAEQWRIGGGNTLGFTVSGTGAIAAADLSTLNTTSVLTGAMPTSTPKSLSLTGLTIANNATFGIQWAGADGSGADNPIAFDDFTLTVPIPCVNPAVSVAAAPTSQAVCQNSTPVNLTLTATGTTPDYQWYSNTSASTTGATSLAPAGQTNTYTPLTNALGTLYYYCVVSGCATSVNSGFVSVTVSAASSATISYPGTPFCSNAGLRPVTQTGTSGGTYSAAAGLSINATTGEINPASSTPGSYTVTYTMAASGGCPIATATTSVTITALPAAVISYPAASFCKTAAIQNITRTGTAGGTYTVSPAGLTISASTGAITPSTSTEGSYTVTYTMTAPGAGCAVNQTAVTTVSIASSATSISPVATQDIAAGVDGTTLTVTEGSTPTGRQWKYGTVAGGPYGTNLGTAVTQVPNFASTGVYYIICESTYPAVPCGGTITSNEVRINVTNNFITTTPATYGPFCNNTANPVSVAFTYTPAANFASGVATFTAQISDASGSFAAATNIGNILSNATGSQSIAATIPAAIAGGTGFLIRVISTNPNTTGTSNGTSFVIGGFPSATIIYPGGSYCGSAGPQTVVKTGTTGGTYSAPIGLDIDPVTGTISPSSSTAGGYVVTYSMPAVGTCPSQTTTANVTITAFPSASIIYTSSPFCSNGTPQTVTRIGTPGGTFTSTAGLSINSATGTISPSLSTAGTYIITYTMPASGGCIAQTATASVTITQAPAASISYAGTPFCSSDLSTKPVTRTGTAGGTYTASPSGLSINASTGTISIFSSTPGTYTVSYTLGVVGGCPFQTATTSVTINTAPAVADLVATPGTTITVPGGSTVLTSSTPGGVWSTSNAALATVSGGTVSAVAQGTPVISYTVTTAGCATTVSTAINVISASGISLWKNNIDGTYPASTNPFLTGQVVNANISVSGIGFAGVIANPGSDRVNTNDWDVALNTNKYFSFTLTPDPGYAIDFKSLVFTSQRSSATGPTTVVVRASTSGSTNIGAPTFSGGNIPLTAAAYQNITTPITFKIYPYGATNSASTFSINDFEFFGNMRLLCTTPNSLEFLDQPSNVPQDQPMSVVRVRASCTPAGITGAGFTGPVVLTVFNGCGYVSQTVNAVAGIATFNNIVFTRSAQTGVQLKAFATGFSVATSSSFNVTAPGGSASNTTIITENFEGAVTWPFTVGTPIVVGSGGTSGADYMAVKSFTGNKAFVKSYTVDNSSNKLGSTNTVTFANQLIPASYSHATFNFQVASLGPSGIGTGGGNDAGEDMSIEIALDGGTVWNKLLTYRGYSDYLFALAPSPVTALAYNANATYSTPSTASAFTVSLPNGATQFRFRMTATNNRSTENWALDNISLVGTGVTGAGVTNPLPIVANSSLQNCPNNNATITVVTSNTVGVVSYVWTPNTNITNNTLSNPIVNPPGTTTYTATITDADGCTAAGTVSILMPAGTSGVWTGANTTDWFECNNWGAGVLPTAATDVIINSTAPRAAEIDAASSFANPYPGIANAKSITINSNTLRIQANGVLNIANALNIQTAAVLDMTNGGNLSLAGAWTNSAGAAGFLSGIGTVTYNSTGAVSQTIAPENYFNLSSASTGNRVLSPSGIIGIGGTFTPNIPGNAYTVVNSTIDYNKAGTQAVAGFKYYNLNLSGGGAFTKTLAADIEVQATFNLATNTKFALANFNTTLKSNAAGTANVAAINTTNSISYGTGQFVVERYIPTGVAHGKSWQLLAVPVSGSQSVNASWQEGLAPLAHTPATDGFGTTISSEKPNATARGYDFTTPVGPSIKTFNSAANTWAGIDNGSTNTNALGIANKKGYMLFVRGDRNVQTSAAAANATTLRTKGKLFAPGTDAAPSTSVAALKFETVGNPFASTIDFINLLTLSPGIDSKFYVWDPLLAGTNNYGYGGYQVLSSVTGWVPTPGTTANYPSGIPTTKIQSGQAFFAYSTGGGTVNFAESNKLSGSSMVFRQTAGISQKQLLRAYLAGSNGTITDGNVVAFDSAYSNSFEANDALKISDVKEGFGITMDNKILSIDARKPVISTDTVFYDIRNVAVGSYRFVFAPENLNMGLEAALVDKFLHTKTQVSLTDSSFVDFDISTDAVSKAADRFYLVFKMAAPVPVTFVSIAANRNRENNIEVNWKVENELNIAHYNVERSSDGQHFVSIGSKRPTDNNGGTALYNDVDVKVPAGAVFYRISSVNTEAALQHSAVVKVRDSRSLPSISIYPNPVTDKTVNLLFTNQEEGSYNLQLTNIAGQVVYKGTVEVNNSNVVKSFILPAETAAGIYQLSIISSKAKMVQKVLVQ